MNDIQTAQTLATIQQFQEAFNAHDVDAVMALMTDECVFENTYPPPDGARYTGQAAVRAFWEEFFTSSPHARFVTEDHFAAGQRGVVCWMYTWMDQEGKQGRVRGVDIFHICDGKVGKKLSYVKG
jgi:ketosteroid isomerase-like protein